MLFRGNPPFQCVKLPISERDMEKEHQTQMAKRKAAREKAKNPEGGKKKKSKSKKSPDSPESWHKKVPHTAISG